MKLIRLDPITTDTDLDLLAEDIVASVEEESAQPDPDHKAE